MPTTTAVPGTLSGSHTWKLSNCLQHEDEGSSLRTDRLGGKVHKPAGGCTSESILCSLHNYTGSCCMNMVRLCCCQTVRGPAV